MADLLEDFGSFFTTSGLTTGYGIYFDIMLDKSPQAIAIYEYQGHQVPVQVDGAHRSIQIVVRASSAEVAKAKANELYKALAPDDGIVNLTAERWAVIDLKQTPFKLKVDEKNLVYYCFNAGVQTYID